MVRPATARPLLFIALAFVLYASLYPLKLHPVPGPFWPLLFAIWRARLGFILPGDIAANVFMYMPVGLLLFFALPRSWGRAARVIAGTLLGVLLSSVMEVAQFFDFTRISSLNDILANSAGALIGSFLGMGLESRPVVAARAAQWFLLAMWAVSLLLLAFSRHPSTGFVTPASAALAGIAIIAEMSGLLPPGLQRSAALLLLAALVWRELAPFHLSASPQSFSWIPFASSFTASRGSGIVTFLNKAFFYGATIWFSRRLLHSIGTATVLIALLLLILEGAQVYLPGRTPEISDSVLAILVGSVLYLLDERSTLATPSQSGTRFR